MNVATGASVEKMREKLISVFSFKTGSTTIRLAGFCWFECVVNQRSLIHINQ
jgi:hypothetical protein